MKMIVITGVLGAGVFASAPSMAAEGSMAGQSRGAPGLLPVARCEALATTDDRLRCYRNVYCADAEDRTGCLSRVITALLAGSGESKPEPAREEIVERVEVVAETEVPMPGLSQPAMVEPRPQARPPAAVASERDRFGSRKFESQTERISARIVGLYEQKYGEFVIKLDNGMIWEEKARTATTFNVGERIEIVRGFFNSYRAKSESGAGARVRRLFCDEPKLDAETKLKCDQVRS